MTKIEVREGKLPWLIGIGTIAAGVVIGILSVVYAKNPVYIKNSFIIVIAIILAGAMMCFCAKNRSITVQGGQLCYKNCFGRKKAFVLSDIGYCSAALESGRSRDYLILYDISGTKLCKLEFNMENAYTFLLYLKDNDIKIECSKNSDLYLKWMAGARSITQNDAVSVAKDAYEKMKELIVEWVKRNESFGAGWKFGLAFYIEEKFVQEKQLWEQEGAPVELADSLLDDTAVRVSDSFAEDGKVTLPEGFFIVLEGYLQKDGKFVIDRKNQVVSVSAMLIQVSKSMQESGSMNMGEELKIYFYGDAPEYISEQLSYYEQILPKRRYHTEALELKHELYLEK